MYAVVGNRFAKAGIGVAIPSYRLMPKSPHPAQIRDVAEAFAWVYQNAGQYGGDSKRMYLAGHSAGGHLASTLDTHFDAGNSQAADPVDRQGCRPDFAVIIYPGGVVKRGTIELSPEICVTSVTLFTWTGVSLQYTPGLGGQLAQNSGPVLVPSPSWPLPLSPQAQTVPSLSNARLW